MQFMLLNFKWQWRPAALTPSPLFQLPSDLHKRIPFEPCNASTVRQVAMKACSTYTITPATCLQSELTMLHMVAKPCHNPLPPIASCTKLDNVAHEDKNMLQPIVCKKCPCRCSHIWHRYVSCGYWLLLLLIAAINCCCWLSGFSCYWLRLLIAAAIDCCY